MKRMLLLSALLAFRLPVLAQRSPNGSFETWTATDLITNCLTTNDILLAALGLPIPTGTISKTTDVYADSFAAKVETKNVAPFGISTGYLVLGTRLNMKNGGFGGLPFTGRRPCSCATS